MSGSTRISEVRLDRATGVAEGASLREVAATMEDARTSCLVVGEGPLRIVTDHDLAGALSAGLGADATVGVVATREPVWATPSTTVREAVEMMLAHGIRHLLVVKPDGQVDGVLPLTTATRWLLEG